MRSVMNPYLYRWTEHLHIHMYTVCFVCSKDIQLLKIQCGLRYTPCNSASHVHTGNTDELASVKMNIKKTQNTLHSHINHPALVSAAGSNADPKPPPTAPLFTETPMTMAQNTPRTSLCSAPLSDPVPTQSCDLE